jgi:RNA polymerase sigma-70 factor (ECF subfamily)
MTQSDPAVAPETLLSHAAWMRRLARSLVKDDAQADDVVQDAVVAAMRAPPRDAVALPAWLATTVRNGAKQLWRGESRRAARESAGARPEATPSTVEVVARAEEHGLVVQAVLALEEPYRSTLLLRFYDDLPPRDVAARTGVPVETARARIRRGLEQLRGRLDRAHGGDGKAWRLALAPLILHKTAASVGAGTGAAAGHQLTTGAMVMAGTGSVAAVGAVALAVGVATGWWFGATKSDSVAAGLNTSLIDEKRQVATLTSDLAERDARAKKLADESESKLRAAQKESAELRKQLDESNAAFETAKAAAAKASAPPSLTAPAPSPKGPRFAFGQFGKLAEVDWKSVGENLNAIAPLAGDVMTKLKKDGEMPGDEIGKLQQHNGPLVAAAVKVMKDLPGTGANGSFTHPAFQVNAIAAALDAAGKPLTDAEASALEKIGREFSDEDARRLQAYDASTYALQKTIDEADLRRRFFDAAFAALTPDQRDTLTPPAVKGVLGFDLYSDGLIWITVMRQIQFKEGDADAHVTAAAGAMNTALKIPKEQQDAARGVVAKWAHDLPASLVTASSEPGAEYDRHVEPVRESAKQTLALLQRLVADLKLEGAQGDAARKWPAALVPDPQKNE